MSGGEEWMLDDEIWRPDALGVIPGLALLRNAEPSPVGRRFLYRPLTTIHRRGVVEGAEHVIGFDAVHDRLPYELRLDARTDPAAYAVVNAGQPGQGILLSPTFPFERIGFVSANINDARVSDSFRGFDQPSTSGVRSGFITRDATRDRFWQTVLCVAGHVGNVAVVASLDESSHHLEGELIERAGFETMTQAATRHGLSPVDTYTLVATWEAVITDGHVEFNVDFAESESESAMARLAWMVATFPSSANVADPDVANKLRQRAADLKPSGTLTGRVTRAGADGMGIKTAEGDWSELETVLRVAMLDRLGGT